MAMMTEKEFLDGVRAEIVAGKPMDTAARNMAIRAGVEFAPEPVRLPDRLEAIVLGKANHQVYLGTERGIMPSDRVAVYEAAAARYNAYPGLREAAEAAVRVIEHLWPIREQLGASLLGVVEGIKAELAKGPK